MALVCATLPALAVPNVQDMWWGGPEESGWGVSIIQHEERLFCVLYVYDETAHTTWFVVPQGTWNEAGTVYHGTAYYPRGTDFYAYDPARFEPGDPYGEITIAFASPDAATLTYALGPARGTKAITRQPFTGSQRSNAIDATDMWWGGPSQAGWGVSIVRHGDALLIVWFTYFQPNRRVPTWFVMPGGTWTDANTYEGRIYRPFGSAWLGQNFASTRIVSPDNGPFRLTFQDRDHATLEYSVLGDYSGFLELTREPF